MPTSNGFRRLNNESIVSRMDRRLPPPPQQISPNGAPANYTLDKWKCIKDSSGVTYYWSPVAKVYCGNVKCEGMSKLVNGFNTFSSNPYPSNNKNSTNHQKIVPSGYSPNRFPLTSSYFTNVSIAKSGIPQPAGHSGNALLNGYCNYGQSNAVTYPNTSSVYSNVPTDLISSGYYDYTTRSLGGYPNYSVDSSGCYENVLTGKLSNLNLKKNDSSYDKNGAYYHLSVKKDGNIIGSNNNVIGYSLPPLNEKRMLAYTENGICKSDSHTSNQMIPVKNHPQNDNKATNGIQRGASRSSLSRDKPRVPKFFQSLCCCLRSSTDESLKRRSLHTPSVSLNPPNSIITQVKKESGNGYDSGLEKSVSSENAAYPTDEVLDMDAFVPQCSDKLLPALLPPSDTDKNCLIIDLDETLVHSSFKPVENPDFVIPVEIDNVTHQVFVLKRPFVDEFLERIGNRFECVLFTASLAKYADPVADLLDKRRIFRTRLFRESCVVHKGNYVKDLTKLGRDLRKIIIVDNSPASYAFHPENAIAVPSWFDDMNDAELLTIIPLLEQLADVDDIYSVLRNSNDEMRRCSLLESSNDTRSTLYLTSNDTLPKDYRISCVE